MNSSNRTNIGHNSSMNPISTTGYSQKNGGSGLNSIPNNTNSESIHPPQSISRKMSLAAKSGQMQVFNNFQPQNLNIENQYKNQSINADDNADIKFSQQSNRLMIKGNHKQSFNQFDSQVKINKINDYHINAHNSPLTTISNKQNFSDFKNSMNKHPLSLPHQSTNQNIQIIESSQNAFQQNVDNQLNQQSKEISPQGFSQNKKFSYFKNSQKSMGIEEKSKHEIDIIDNFIQNKTKIKKIYNNVPISQSFQENIPHSKPSRMEKEYIMTNTTNNSIGGTDSKVNVIKSEQTQFETYLQKNKLIQLQREKKLEIIKSNENQAKENELKNSIQQIDLKADKIENQQNNNFQNLKLEGIQQSMYGRNPMKLDKKTFILNRIAALNQNNVNQFANQAQGNKALADSQTKGIDYMLQHHMHSQVAGININSSSISPNRGSKQILHQNHFRGPQNYHLIQSSQAQHRMNIQSIQEKTSQFLIDQQSSQLRFKNSNTNQISNNLEFQNQNNQVHSLSSNNNVFGTNLQSKQILNRHQEAGFQQEFSQYLQNQIVPLKNLNSQNEGNSTNDMNQYFSSNNAYYNNQIPSAAQQQILKQVNQNPNIKIDEKTDIQPQQNNNNAQNQASTEEQTNLNKQITRKIEGRPHKIFDYMFIQMSNEQFQRDYAGRKILIMNNEESNQKNGTSPKINKQNSNQNVHENNESKSQQEKQYEHQSSDAFKRFSNEQHQKDNDRKMHGQNQFMSPSNNNMNPLFQEPDLNGLVKIKAYENQLTDEIPQVQCNLLPTQLDHLKVLVCEQEDKNHQKLTADAANRFEIEKQTQIKQYMEDIIAKLQQKERRFKVTVKKKFVDDALFNSTQIRVASVYVIVINREKTYDHNSNNNQRLFKSRKRISQNKLLIESSSDEDEILEGLDPITREEYLRNEKLRESLRRSANPNLVHLKKRSMYDSDTNGGHSVLNGDMNSTCKSSNMPQSSKLMNDKSQSLNPLGLYFGAGNIKFVKNKKENGAQNGQGQKKNGKLIDDIGGYKFSLPVKEHFQKYGPTKIRIIQDLNAHSHHNKHPINVFFHQYNEFIKLVLKNQKLQNQSQSISNGPVYKFNNNYAMGLAKALGLNLKRDAFSESNMKSRDYVCQLKEKLIFCFWRKLNESNKDLTPHLNYSKDNLQIQQDKANSLNNSNNNEEIDRETIDSSSNQNNTPRSKNLKIQKESEKNNTIAQIQQTSLLFQYPPSNVNYKYFIGKGNNSMMIRSLFKNRYWWVQHDREEMEKCNFCWTQIKNSNLMEVLPCKYPQIKSGIKNISYNNSQQQNIQQILTTPQQKSNKKQRVELQNTDKLQKQKAVQANGSGSNNQQNNQNQNQLQNGLTVDQIQKWTDCKMYNKIEDNYHLNNKKALYINMKNYYEAIGQDVFDNLPLTFHIKTGLEDPEFHKFRNYYNKLEDDIKNKRKHKRKEAFETKKVDNDQEQGSPQVSPEKQNQQKEQIEEAQNQKESQYYQSPAPPKNIWIIKPGENTNRGQGIQVAKEFEEIKQIIVESTTNGKRTCIVQKYIHNPLLINRRKFDIRTYVLMTSINGNTKLFIYEEGYLRTSCREYSINNLANKFVHLTNDAVQKRADDYGKFEPGNKLSYNEFQMFLDKNYPDLNICFERDIKTQMNKLTTDIFRAVYTKLDPKRRLHCMEIFGLDFMIDDEFKPYLIEVNTNPCLELASPLLARLIPNMVENALKIGLDAQFLPPEFFSQKKAFIGDPCPENRFELVFDSIIDGPVLDQLYKNKENMIVEMDEDELSEEEVHDDEE